jgi:hypothetical protein
VSGVPCAPDLTLATDLLRQAAAAARRGNAEVAERLGVTRGRVAQVLLTGKSHYRMSAKLAAKVIATFLESVDCPHTGKPKKFSECRAFVNGPLPTNPQLVQMLRACQSCPHKPEVKK